MLSRKQIKEMKDILKFATDVEGNQNLLIHSDNDSFWCRVGGPTDEGYSYTTYVVSVNEDQPEWYNLSRDDRSRDCDGPHYSGDDYLVKIRNKAQRFYMGYDKRGKFFSRRLVWKNVDSFQRDFYAESMGY